jgi:predicted amidohydrolase YtcJ
MHSDGALRLRVHKCVRQDDLELAISEGRRAGLGDAMFQVGPVKFFSDGALGSHTAHMTEPFIGHEGCGIAVTPYPVLLERIRMSLEAGLDVATHAIGDEANRLVLDAFGTMRAEGRHNILRIEHAQHLRLDDVPRFRELGVIASMQPSHCPADLELVDELLGERPVATYAWRTLLDAGAVLAFGSDAPVEDPNPLYGLHAAVTRQRADGMPPGGWRPEERISMDEAVHAFTVGSYEAVGRTDVGRLAVGQLADLIAVDRDLWTVDPAQIRDAQVLQTVVGGEVVFTR